MSSAVVPFEAEVLSRTVSPGDGDLSPEAAQALLRLRLKPDDCLKVNQLVAKAREGELTEDERAKLDGYEHVGFLLELLKSKARLSLKRAGLEPDAD